MSDTEFDLSDKVAIVIGGTKGMGATISELFVRSGARVVINSRTEREAEAFATSLNETYGHGPTVAVPCAGDMTDRRDLERVVSSAKNAFGKVTTLVLSPTIRPWFGPSIETPDEVIDEQFLYVFKCRFWITSLCIPEMIDAGGGSVVYIGSGSAFESTAERSVYSCMRAAEVQMMRNFAAEHGEHDIRFNIISPGLIDAHGSKSLFADPEAVASIVAGMPMRRHGETSEIADAAAFLASDASSFTTGAVLPVDGGRLLHAKPRVLTGAFAAEQEASMQTKGPAS